MKLKQWKNIFHVIVKVNVIVQHATLQYFAYSFINDHITSDNLYYLLLLCKT